MTGPTECVSYLEMPSRPRKNLTLDNRCDPKFKLIFTHNFELLMRKLHLNSLTKKLYNV
jgi:hypothetical protein